MTADSVPINIPNRRGGLFRRPMDPLTHSLLGAGLGYATLGRKLGRRAALAGALAAVAPDVDVFIRSASDPLLAIEHHRGFTHSLAFAPVGAAVVATVVWAFGRREWLSTWACCLIAYVSHALLDAATSYGTQLTWPFSDHRAGWDLISIIDPPFTLVLAVGLAVALIRQKLRPVIVALALAAGYIAFGALQHARGVAVTRAVAASRGHTPERIEVMPTLANNLVWRALYLHDGRIHSDRVRVGWFSRPTVRTGWSLPLVTSLTPAEDARNAGTRSFERFRWFSDDWVARDPAQPGVLGDMRYSLSSEAFDPIWGIRFEPAGAPVPVAWVNRTRERRIEPGELWREISGRDPRFRPVAD
jgi:inner membrane protein